MNDPHRPRNLVAHVEERDELRIRQTQNALECGFWRGVRNAILIEALLALLCWGAWEMWR